MNNSTYQLETLDNGQLNHLLRHCYAQCFRSFETLENALEAHIRHETLPVPIWVLREAYNDNMIRFENVMREIERRQIP